MKKFIYILFICTLLVSCTSRTIYEKPDDLIAKEQMVDLWVDIIIANAASSVKNEKAQRKVNYMPFVYQKYQIDSARFMQSNIYYTSKIEEYEKMFEEVQVKLNKIKEIYVPFSEDEEDDIGTILSREKRDSLKIRNELKNKKRGQEIEEEKKTLQ